ncbi:MAG TPA: c-type cytochrome, partial [Pirellulaceae bacterium]|nr:c-type cytochrome [Pirellulaceae bacterium]
LRRHLPLDAAAATAAESGFLEQRLLGEPRAALVAAADAEGDPVRGAIVFHQPYLLCTKCHSLGDAAKSLGPDLVKLGPEATTAAIVEAILEPSKTIRKGFEPWVVTTTDGRMLTGLLVEQSADGIALREATGDGRITRIPTSQIDERNSGRVSLMPVGLVNQLNSRQQFLDLVAYLRAIATGGARRAAELQPPPGSYAVAPLPEYEERLDHARLISGWNAESLRRGEAIYQRVCANCHGTHEMPGSLPTSLKFASGKFKNGSDPLSLYRTLTRGFGLMMPQTWMVPRQKYDVIHYLREAYLKSHNPTQFVAVDAAYLATLPRGDTLGPEPSKIEPWVAMDYGSFLIATYEFGDDASNFAHKGIAVRLDAGPGGVSRGRRWQVFDHGTLRMAGTWRAGGKPGESNFINWDGINFNGRHGVHPRVSGMVGVTNPTGPGWAHPVDDRWDDPRVQGRDGRRYGPLPSDWGKYQGLYQNGERVVVSYRVGSTEVLELPGYVETSTPIATRTLRVGPRSRPLQLAVGQLPDQTNAKVIPLTKTAANPIWFGPPASP